MKYFSIKNNLINLDNILKISLKKDEQHIGDLDLYHVTFTYTNGSEDTYDILQDKLRELMDGCNTSIELQTLWNPWRLCYVLSYNLKTCCCSDSFSSANNLLWKALKNYGWYKVNVAQLSIGRRMGQSNFMDIIKRRILLLELERNCFRTETSSVTLIWACSRSCFTTSLKIFEIL